MKDFEEFMKIVGDFFERMIRVIADCDIEEVFTFIFGLTGLLFIPALAFLLVTCDTSPNASTNKYNKCVKSGIKKSECYYQVYGKRDETKSNNN